MLTRNVISAYPGYMLKHCQTHWCRWSLSETEVVQVGSFLMNPLKPCTSVSTDICKIPGMSGNYVHAHASFTRWFLPLDQMPMYSSVFSLSTRMMLAWKQKQEGWTGSSKCCVVLWVYHALSVPSTYCQPKMSFQQLNIQICVKTGRVAPAG